MSKYYISPTGEVIEPAFWEVDVYSADDAPVLLHSAGSEIAVEDRFHPDFVSTLLPYDPNNPPLPPEPPLPPADPFVIRQERNQKLCACDWTQVLDSPDGVAEAWAPYRQALRDLPQQDGFPDSVEWPTPPEQ